MITSIRKGGHIVISISNEKERLIWRKVRLYSASISEYPNIFETMGCVVEPTLT